MFKKSEPELPSSNDSPAPAVYNPPPPAATPSRTTRGELATIGPSIRIRGDLTGEEDLVIQGDVEGTVNLASHLVTVGKEGRVAATVNARGITVEGTVEGDLNGEEQVVLQRSSNVRGNITAPRVTLEDGCRFKGAIDMDVAASDAPASRPKAASPSATSSATTMATARAIHRAAPSPASSAARTATSSASCRTPSAGPSSASAAPTG